MKKNPIMARSKEYLKQLIKDEIKVNGYECDLNFIDVRDIDDMSYLFSGSQFNGYISKWNTSNVKDMQGMFEKSNFDKDINNWDVSNVKRINDIFEQSKCKNIPYWAKIEDLEERQQKIELYQKSLKEKLLLNNEIKIINQSKNTENIFKI